MKGEINTLYCYGCNQNILFLPSFDAEIALFVVHGVMREIECKKASDFRREDTAQRHLETSLAKEH